MNIEQQREELIQIIKNSTDGIVQEYTSHGTDEYKKTLKKLVKKTESLMFETVDETLKNYDVIEKTLKPNMRSLKCALFAESGLAIIEHIKEKHTFISLLKLVVITDYLIEIAKEIDEISVITMKSLRQNILIQMKELD